MRANALSAIPESDERSRRLRPLEPERKGARFAALDFEVARVLGSRRGEAVIYGFLASTWFEYAPPVKLGERKRKVAPGDWVEVSYPQFMEIAGTRSRDSVIRWIRNLAEDTYACPWGRCKDEHPLIVVVRPGQNQMNRYRKWDCGADSLVMRRKISSPKLKEAARKRQLESQELEASAEGISPRKTAHRTSARVREDRSEDRSPDVRDPQGEDRSPDSQRLASDDLQADIIKTADRTFARPLSGGSEDRASDARKTDQRSSLRENTINTDYVGQIDTKSAAKPDAAATIEYIDEVDAVACEVVDAIWDLAQRVDEQYQDDQAWAVARRLAAPALALVDGDAAAARTLLRAAIVDRRLSRATNPIGLLVRGILGDEHGRDRFLIGKLPPAAPKHVERPDATVEAHAPSTTPLADQLAKKDIVAYNAELKRMLALVTIPDFAKSERRLDHPMVLGLCRSRLEAELQQNQNLGAP
jgi:hypothetical protein